MTNLPFAVVGFNLDGTLVDTSGDLAAAVNVALADAGRPALTRAPVEPMIGGGAKIMLGRALDALGRRRREFNRLYAMLLESYGANISVHSRPYPGMLDATAQLTALG